MKTTETYTFANGQTVGVMRVSPDLLRTIRRSFPPPEPPVQHTDLGDEPNAMDPDYLIAMADYEQMLGDKIFDLLILRGVWVQVDKEAVEQLRADVRELGVELPKNDKIVYVRHVLLSDTRDYAGLQAAIVLQGQPTEEAIQGAQAEFKSDAPGA